MTRHVRNSERFLLLGLGLILVFMVTHDWISFGSLNDIQAVKEVHTFNELVTVTMINGVQILILMGLVLIFIGKRYPIFVKLWLIIHPACIFVGALYAWWIPYFTGIGAEAKVERYQQMFGNTHSFLPVINGIVPNTLHVIFHSLLFTCILLAIYISFTGSKERK
jgi:hypothetical protein